MGLSFSSSLSGLSSSSSEEHKYERISSSEEEIALQSLLQSCQKEDAKAVSLLLDSLQGDINEEIRSYIIGPSASLSLFAIFCYHPFICKYKIAKKLIDKEKRRLFYRITGILSSIDLSDSVRQSDGSYILSQLKRGVDPVYIFNATKWAALPPHAYSREGLRVICEVFIRIKPEDHKLLNLDLGESSFWTVLSAEEINTYIRPYISASTLLSKIIAQEECTGLCCELLASLPEVEEVKKATFLHCYSKKDKKLLLSEHWKKIYLELILHPKGIGSLPPSPLTREFQLPSLCYRPIWNLCQLKEGKLTSKEKYGRFSPEELNYHLQKFAMPAWTSMDPWIPPGAKELIFEFLS